MIATARSGQLRSKGSEPAPLREKQKRLPHGAHYETLRIYRSRLSGFPLKPEFRLASGSTGCHTVLAGISRLANNNSMLTSLQFSILT